MHDALSRVQRGLCGYVSYLAACEMNQAFSEYVLYEPILRILTSRNYTVLCEYECPGIDQPLTGDKKRLDFYAERADSTWALEVKWAKATRLNVSGDTEKLRAFLESRRNASAFLLVFGRKSHIHNKKWTRLFGQSFEVLKWNPAGHAASFSG